MRNMMSVARVIPVSALLVLCAMGGVAAAQHPCVDTTYTNGAACVTQVPCIGLNTTEDCAGNGKCLAQANSTPGVDENGLPAVCCWCGIRGGGSDPGETMGEPHITTFDGLAYDFQAAGEFVLTTDNHTFMVQVRQEPLVNNPSIAVNTAVATRVGSVRVAFYVDESPPLRVDGTPTDVPCAYGTGSMCRGKIDLSGGGEVHRAGAVYTVAWPLIGRKLQVEMLPHVHLLNIAFVRDPDRDRDLALIGLLGDGDGKEHTVNDLRTRDGDVLLQPLSYDQMYNIFGESLRIQQHESLFDYRPGETTATFTHRNLPGRVYLVSDLDPVKREAAEKVCRKALVTNRILLDACTLDVAVLDNELAAAIYVNRPAPVAETQAYNPREAPDRKRGVLWLALGMVVAVVLAAMYRRRRSQGGG